MVPMEHCLSNIIRAIKPLSHPVRLKIVHRLCHCEACVTELADIMQAPMSVISQHLAVLLSHGLIAVHRNANRNFYRVKRDDLALLVQALCEHENVPALEVPVLPTANVVMTTAP